MLLKFIRAIGNSTYKIYDPLGIKLLTRLQLGFSHLSEHKFRHNFADSINPLCSCSLENESTHSIYSLRRQNYTTLRRALTTYLENINDANMSLNESDLLQELNISIQLVYSESVRHEYKYTTGTIKCIKDSKGLINLLLKTLLLLHSYLFNFVFKKSVVLQLGFLLYIFQ